MKFKGNLISPVYYQLYITFSKEEINECYEEVKLEISSFNEFERKIRFQGNNGKKLTKSYYDSIERLAQVKEKYADVEKLSIAMIQNTIYSELNFEIGNRHMNLIGDMNINYLNKIEKDKPLTAVATFCFLEENFKLKLPDFQYKKFHLSKNEREIIINDLLISNGYCRNYKITEISENCHCLVEIISSTTEKEVKTFDIYNLAQASNQKISNLLGLKVGDSISGFYKQKNVQLIIRKITRPVAKQLTDEIVESFNLKGVHTKGAFEKKIILIYANILNTNITVIGLVKAMTKLNDFGIDEYVYAHYKEEIEEFPKKLNDPSFQYSNVQEFLGAEFVIGKTLRFCEFNPKKVIKQIRKEYKILQLIRGKEIVPFQDYYRYRYSVILLYDYFKQKKIV